MNTFKCIQGSKAVLNFFLRVVSEFEYCEHTLRAIHGESEFVEDVALRASLIVPDILLPFMDSFEPEEFIVFYIIRKSECFFILDDIGQANRDGIFLRMVCSSIQYVSEAKDSMFSIFLNS